MLDGFPSGNPYRVPDGYFNEFPLKLKERLVQPSMVEKIKAPSRRFIYTQLAYAASFALLVSFGYFGIRSLQPTKTAQPNAKVMVAKASNGTYVDFDESSLIDALQDDHRKVTTTVTDDETKDAMIQYLVEDNVDYATLVEKY